MILRFSAKTDQCAAIIAHGFPPMNTIQNIGGEITELQGVVLFSGPWVEKWADPTALPMGSASIAIDVPADDLIGRRVASREDGSRGWLLPVELATYYLRQKYEMKFRFASIDELKNGTV